MSIPNFRNHCALLAQISGSDRVDSANKQAWSDFLRDNEIGLLFALVFGEGLVTPATSSGIEIVEDTYARFCEVLGLDPNAAYESLEEAVQASPRPGITLIKDLSDSERRGDKPLIASPLGIDSWEAASTVLSRVNVRRIAQLTGTDLEAVEDAVDGDPFEQNNLGDRLMEVSEIDTGLRFLAASAHQGLPWAVSNFTWHCLETEQFERAKQLFQSTKSACENFVWTSSQDLDEAWELKVRQQWANSRSNDALRSLGMNEDPTYALNVWAEGAATRHPESMFYPALVYWNSGQRERAMAHLLALDPDILSENKQILTGVTRSARGWFRSWASDGLEVLAELDRTKSSPAHSRSAVPTRSFCGYCGVRREQGNIFCTSCGKKYD